MEGLLFQIACQLRAEANWARVPSALNIVAGGDPVSDLGRRSTAAWLAAKGR
jgi:hypothetical protein